MFSNQSQCVSGHTVNIDRKDVLVITEDGHELLSNGCHSASIAVQLVIGARLRCDFIQHFGAPFAIRNHIIQNSSA